MLSAYDSPDVWISPLLQQQVDTGALARRHSQHQRGGAVLGKKCEKKTSKSFSKKPALIYLETRTPLGI